MTVLINNKNIKNPLIKTAVLITGIIIAIIATTLVLPIVGVSLLAVLGLVGIFLLILAITLPILLIILKKRVGADININFNKSDFLHKEERANDFPLEAVGSLSLTVPKGDIYIKRHEYEHLHLHCSSHNTYFQYEDNKLNLVIDSESNGIVNLYLPTRIIPLHINLGTGKCVIDDNPTNDFHLNLGKGNFEAYKFRGDAQINMGMGDIFMEYRQIENPSNLSINTASTKARVFLPPLATLSVSNIQLFGNFSNALECSKDGLLKVKINSVKSDIQILKTDSIEPV